MKRCSKCGEEKELSAFHVAKLGRFGRTAVCKTCAASYNALRYKATKADLGKYAALRQQQNERRRGSGVASRIDRSAEARIRTRKICSRCRTEKSLDAFYGNHQSLDGKGDKCKPCAHLARREWAAANPRKIKTLRAKEYRKIADDPQARAEFFKKSSDRHKRKYAADPEYAARCRAKTTLVSTMGLSIRTIPKELIEAKAAQLLVRRETMTQAASLQIRAEEGVEG